MSPGQVDIPPARQRGQNVELVIRPLVRPDLGQPEHARVFVCRPLHPKRHIAPRPAGGVAEGGVKRWTFLAERH